MSSDLQSDQKHVLFLAWAPQPKVFLQLQFFLSSGRDPTVSPTTLRFRQSFARSAEIRYCQNRASFSEARSRNREILAATMADYWNFLGQKRDQKWENWKSRKRMKMIPALGLLLYVLPSDIRQNYYCYCC